MLQLLQHILCRTSLEDHRKLQLFQNAAAQIIIDVTVLQSTLDLYKLLGTIQDASYHLLSSLWNKADYFQDY